MYTPARKYRQKSKQERNIRLFFIMARFAFLSFANIEERFEDYGEDEGQHIFLKATQATAQRHA